MQLGTPGLESPRGWGECPTSISCSRTSLVLIFARRHIKLLQRIVYICCLQFFMSMSLFNSLQSGIYPHSCHSQI